MSNKRPMPPPLSFPPSKRMMQGGTGPANSFRIDDDSDEDIKDDIKLQPPTSNTTTAPKTSKQTPTSKSKTKEPPLKKPIAKDSPAARPMDPNTTLKQTLDDMVAMTERKHREALDKKDNVWRSEKAKLVEKHRGEIRIWKTNVANAVKDEKQTAKRELKAKELEWKAEVKAKEDEIKTSEQTSKAKLKAKDETFKEKEAEWKLQLKTKDDKIKEKEVIGKAELKSKETAWKAEWKARESEIQKTFQNRVNDHIAELKKKHADDLARARLRGRQR